MSRVVLAGVDGANPLGFMAAIGLLRVLDAQRPGVRLAFADDGSFRAYLEGTAGLELPAIIARDAAAAGPLWSEAATAPTVRSLLQATIPRSARERELRGIFATCTSAIRRTSQGFGNFAPAVVSA